MIELSVPETIPGHLYSVEAHGMIGNADGPTPAPESLPKADNQTVRWWARYTTDGSPPTISSPFLATDHTLCRFDEFPYENMQAHLYGEFEETSPVPRTLRVGLSFSNSSGATSVSLYNNPPINQRYFTLKDLGVDPGDTGQVNYMGGGGAPSAPPPTPKVSDETLYPSTWGRIFDQSGALREDGIMGWQGYHPNFGGRAHTFIGFPTTIPADMAGAEITYIKLYTYWGWWARETGGHIAVSTHGHLTPNVIPDGQYPNEITTYPLIIPRHAGYWWTLPTEWHSLFQSGAYRGVVLGPGPLTNDDVFLGKFNGPGAVNAPVLAIGTSRGRQGYAVPRLRAAGSHGSFW